MTITSRFPGHCAVCGGAIRVGEQVEWSKGAGVRHPKCAGKAPATRSAAGKPARRSAPKAQPKLQPGEQQISRMDGRGYDVGATIHASKIAGGGGSDGCYWTVTAQGTRRANEDNQEFSGDGRMSWAHVRPATEAEVAPVAARIAAREQRAQLVRDLGAQRGERVTGRMPADAAVLVPRDLSRSCATGERVAIVDGVILHERVGDPDMCDSWYHYTMQLTGASADLVERVAALIAEAKS